MTIRPQRRAIPPGTRHQSPTWQVLASPSDARTCHGQCRRGTRTGTRTLQRQANPSVPHRPAGAEGDRETEATAPHDTQPEVNATEGATDDSGKHKDDEPPDGEPTDDQPTDDEPVGERPDDDQVIPVTDSDQVPDEVVVMEEHPRTGISSLLPVLLGLMSILAGAVLPRLGPVRAAIEEPRLPQARTGMAAGIRASRHPCPRGAQEAWTAVRTGAMRR